MRTKKTKIRPYNERPRMEQFITNDEMRTASILTAVVNLFGPDAEEKVRTESYAVIRKWQEELEEDKRNNPEWYPDPNDYDGNYYGATT